MKIAFVALSLLALAGCANQQISASPTQDAIAGLSGIGGFATDKLVTDATDAQSNLTQAIAVGALDTNDPALSCVTMANASLGIGAAPAPAFTPKISGIESFASVAYIRAQQLKKAGAGLAIPDSCKIILENMRLDALAQAVKSLPGGGILPVLR